MLAVSLRTIDGYRAAIPAPPLLSLHQKKTVSYLPDQGEKDQSESRLIPLNSSATLFMSLTPNAVWTVVSSRSRATSHI